MRTGAGPVLTVRYIVYATGYETPHTVRPTGHTVHSTYAMATQPQLAKLWPDKCHIWEAATPYLYAWTTPDGRVPSPSRPSRAGSPSPATRPVRALRRGAPRARPGGGAPGGAVRGGRADVRRGHQRE